MPRAFHGSTTATIVPSSGNTATNSSTLGQATSAVRPAVVGIVARDSSGARRGSGVCIRHGTDIVTVQHLMGHSDIETTRQYLDPDESLKRSAVNRLKL